MSTRFATDHEFTTDIDISSLRFWRTPFEERDESFRRLRAEAPVSWHPPFEVAGYPPEVHGQAGFWAITRAEDITRISLDNETFINSQGITTAPVPLEIEALSTFFLGMDPPQHTAYRRLVSAAFTPKAIARITDLIFVRAAQIVDDILERGEFDVVTDFAARLPMMTVCDLIGVPESQRLDVTRAADLFVADFGPDDVPDGMDPLTFRITQAQYLHSVGAELAAHRRENPADDLMTNLVQAEVDGHRLSDDEIGAFMVNLSVAGNDTTKQTTTRTVITLNANPEQRQWLEEDFDGRIRQSIEEFVRYASPVINFARTAVVDAEVGGVTIPAGDKVSLLYCSGNRDETVFEDPWRFDLSRERNPHVGFGGGGVHYCLGNGVAKTQLRALFGEYLRRVPEIELGEPEYMPSNFINGIDRLPGRVG